MTTSEDKALKIIAALEASGFEARFVGGCVRDAVMGRKTGEIDLATTATPIEMQQIFDKSGIRHIPTGIEHGTLTAVIEGDGFEVTTLREDIETDGRHAKVTFTKDWAKDANRRDFTFNALSRDKTGKIYDYTGGLPDAADGRIRFVGVAAERIKEDYLRVLRFFRFLATHGKTAPDAEALKACHEAASHLKDLSRERVWHELKRLLAAPYPSKAWKAMSDASVTRAVLPESHPHRLEKLEEAEKTFSAFARDSILRLAALVHGEKTDAETLQTRFALSNKEAKNLGVFLDFAPQKMGNFSAPRLREIAYRYGIDNAGRFALLAAVLGTQFDWESALSVLENTSSKTLPLKGDDVVALGVTPGPKVGEILQAVEAWWIEHDFTPARDACLTKAKELAKK